MKYVKITIILLLSTIMFSGFWSPSKNTKQLTKEHREDIQQRVDSNFETLRMLYKEVPGSKNKIFKAWGYATFVNFGVTVVFFSGESGKGLAHNSRTGQNIFMNMASGGIGLGLGAKDFRTIFLFKTSKSFNAFVNSKWDMDAQADVAAKRNGQGAASNASVTVASGVTMYKLTKEGLLLQATFGATKYYKDEDLN